jgi:endo-alpha-1,4-polygalactosaminidase (GH114 family)
MTKHSDEKKCAFGVFLDIVDSWQEMNKKDTSPKRASEACHKKCPSCDREIESTAKVCCYCGKAQSE